MRSVLTPALVRGNQNAIVDWQELERGVVEIGPRLRRIHAHAAFSILHENAELDPARLAPLFRTYFRQCMGALAPDVGTHVRIMEDYSRVINYNLKDVQSREAAARALRGGR